MAKTRDGIKLETIISMTTKIPGIEIRGGTKHKYLLSYEMLRPCPIAESTNAKTMVVPWLKKSTGYSAEYIYSSLKNGSWKY
jgi:hypothetical protein